MKANLAKTTTRVSKSRVVSMSNALTRAAHGLNLSEKRLIASAISNLNSKKPAPGGLPPPLRVTAKDFAAVYGLDQDTAYAQLAAATKNLFSRAITFYDPASVRDGKPLAPTRVVIRWVSGARYARGEGWVEITFVPQLMGHLMALKKNFTSYQLSSASGLRSVHSWKLLELLSRFQSTGWAEYSHDDFCEAMEASERQRSDFGKLRTQIIEPAVKELTDKDGWVIEVRPQKRGRKVTSIRFDFKKSRQGRLID